MASSTWWKPTRIQAQLGKQHSFCLRSTLWSSWISDTRTRTELSRPCQCSCSPAGTEWCLWSCPLASPRCSLGRTCRSCSYLTSIAALGSARQVWTHFGPTWPDSWMLVLCTSASLSAERLWNSLALPFLHFKRTGGLFDCQALLSKTILASTALSADGLWCASGPCSKFAWWSSWTSFFEISF